MNKVSVYIEKTNRQEHFVLLDFINEAEYNMVLDFCNIGFREHDGTMILLKTKSGCNFKYPTEGKIYNTTLENFRTLINLYREQPVIENNSPDILLEINLNEHSTKIASEIFNNGHYPSQSSNFSTNSSSNNINKKLSISHINNVIVKNVGHGNWNQIISNSSRDIMFDFGCSFIYSNSERRKLLNNNPLNTFTDLIISHWDVDHYNLINSATDTELSYIKNVYAPPPSSNLMCQKAIKRLHRANITYLSPIAKRLQRRIISLHEISSGNNWYLFSGEQSKNKNLSGLALAIYSSTDCVYFCADHSFRQVFDDMHNHLSSQISKLTYHFIVPHHGGKAGTYNANNFVNSGNCGYAVASSAQNPHGGPRQDTISLFTSLGFNWKETEKVGNDIVII